MIKVYDQVPMIYPKASRDFQYLCWLINIVLNSVKHNVDDIYNLPNTKADSRLTELLAMTLGFKVKRNYDNNQLLAIVNSLPVILKHKGTEYAIQIVGNALIKASGAAGVCTCDATDGYSLTVTLPKTLIDINLFTDILPYILPAGITCKVIRKEQDPIKVETPVYHRDTRIAELVYDYDWDTNEHAATGLTVLFDPDTSSSIEFTNYDSTAQLNEGLWSNTLVPIIDNSSQYLVDSYDPTKTADT